MLARRKLDLEKIRASLVTVCPHCNAILGPEEQNRIDFEHMKCPRCGETFIPGPAPTRQSCIGENSERASTDETGWSHTVGAGEQQQSGA